MKNNERALKRVPNSEAHNRYIAYLSSILTEVDRILQNVRREESIEVQEKKKIMSEINNMKHQIIKIKDALMSERRSLENLKREDIKEADIERELATLLNATHPGFAKLRPGVQTRMIDSRVAAEKKRVAAEVNKLIITLKADKNDLKIAEADVKMLESYEIKLSQMLIALEKDEKADLNLLVNVEKATKSKESSLIAVENLIKNARSAFDRRDFVETNRLTEIKSLLIKIRDSSSVEDAGIKKELAVLKQIEALNAQVMIILTAVAKISLKNKGIMNRIKMHYSGINSEIKKISTMSRSTP